MLPDQHRVYRARNLIFEAMFKLSVKLDLCLSQSKAYLGNPTSFRARAELCLDIPLAFDPEPSLAQIFNLSPSRAKPGHLGLFSSSWLKLKRAFYTLS